MVLTRDTFYIYHETFREGFTSDIMPRQRDIIKTYVIKGVVKSDLDLSASGWELVVSASAYGNDACALSKRTSGSSLDNGM